MGHAGWAAEDSASPRPLYPLPIFHRGVGVFTQSAPSSPYALPVILRRPPPEAPTNLAVAAALGDPDRLFRGPPFPPPAQRCALTWVLSGATCSGGSGNPAAVSKICCQIPRPLQRFEAIVHRRIGAVFRWTALPPTSGLAHIDDPAQNPSIIPRLLARSIHFIGMRGLIFAHCPSFNQNKFALIGWPPNRLTNPLNLTMVN
jgi:hypothetical protein